jgi:TPR repeat protein
VEKNLKTGLEWIQKAANNGFDEAQFELGLDYAEGNFGLSKDRSKAIVWLKKAAVQNFEKATVWLNDQNIK